MHIKIDLFAGKGGPQQSLLAILELVLCEWQTRTRPVQLKQFGFARAVSKHLGIGEKHSSVARFLGAFAIIQELRRAAGYVIDDEIPHDFNVLTERAHL